MARHTDIAPGQGITPSSQERLHRRHTIAAIVYFLYGVFYSLGAQYFTTIESASRGMSGPKLFFVIGWIITLLFPLLIYNHFAIALSLYRKSQLQRKNFFINFTFVLGILVAIRVGFLIYHGSYKESFLHSAALIIAAINAACLFWASTSRPMWVTRHSEEA